MEFFTSILIHHPSYLEPHVTHQILDPQVCNQLTRNLFGNSMVKRVPTEGLIQDMDLIS